MSDQPETDAYLFYNCRILLRGKIQREELYVAGGRVVSAHALSGKQYKRVDCRNHIIAPGFVELQINGAYGVDFSTTKDLRKGLEKVSRILPQSGTTAYCPTLITAYPDAYHHIFPQIKYDPGKGAKGATVLGIHCEGPFISINRSGCHPKECVKAFDGPRTNQIEEMYGDISNLRIITLAPEHPGSPEIISYLTDQGVVVSLGHTSTHLDDAEKGVASGARFITHLFNAMPGFHHRDPSLPGLLVSKLVSSGKGKPRKLLEMILNDENHYQNKDQETDKSPQSKVLDAREIDFALSPGGRSLASDYCPAELFFGIIADGLHTHPAALRMAYRMNPHGLCLVTDAIGAMGLPAGNYKLGMTDVVVTGTKYPMMAVAKGTDTLAGVVAPMDFCVKYFYDVVKCPLAYALEAASLHPARCMGIESVKGHLNIGADADFVILTDDLDVQQTWIAGALSYDKNTYKPETLQVEE